MPPTQPAAAPVRGTGTTGARVIVVDDEPEIRDSVAAAFATAGHAVHALPDGTDLEATIDAFRPDLVVLDVMLPGRDGVTLARVVRGRTDAGIVMLTARDELDDRLAGFDAGADDYVRKPFAVEELLARCAAVLRRLGRLPQTVEVGDLVLDRDGAVASRAGRVLELTGTEHRVLTYLVANRGRTLSKTQILTQVWGYDDYDPNLVEVHVSALRRKLEQHGPRLIHTVRGLGYVLRP